MNFTRKQLIIAAASIILLGGFGYAAIFDGSIFERKTDKVSDFFQTQNSEIQFLSPKKDFKSDENPELKFQYQKTDKGIVSAISKELGLDGKEDKIKITAKVTNPKGEIENVLQEEIIENNGEISVKLKNSAQFKPGLYKIVLEVDNQGVKKEITQDFTWGVLTVNVNKSIYLKGENAYIQMGVLKNNGKTECDANLKLKIKNEKLKIETEFSTVNGTIKYSGKCNGDNITDTPDYFSYYQVGGIGTYQMILMRIDSNTGEKISEITDSFEVRESVPFEVERIGPTKNLSAGGL